MAELSTKDLSALRDKFQSTLAKAKAIRADAEELAFTVIHGAETVGAAFVAGYTQGRYQGASLFGVPAEVAAGLALVGGGLFEVAGDASPHLTAIGVGGLAAWSSNVGRGRGYRTFLRKAWEDAAKLALAKGEPVPAPPQEIADELMREAQKNPQLAAFLGGAAGAGAGAGAGAQARP